MNNNLEDIEAGDQVILYTGTFGRTKEVRTVSRTTATQILIRITDTYEARFYKKDGWLVGRDRFTRMHIARVTPERLEEIEIDKLNKKAIDLRGRLPIPDSKEDLERFIEAITPFVPEKKE